MSIVPTVDHDTLATWLEREEAILIDVREEPFFRAGLSWPLPSPRGGSSCPGSSARASFTPARPGPAA